MTANSAEKENNKYWDGNKSSREINTKVWKN